MAEEASPKSSSGNGPKKPCAAGHLLNLTHDALFVRDMNNIITTGTVARGLYGWTAEQVVGKVRLPAAADGLPAPRTRSTRSCCARPLGRRALHDKADATRVVVDSRWSLQRDERERPLAVLETNNDNTERKRAEDAVRRQANLLEQTHDAIIVWEFPRTIIFWNRGAEQLYGFSREEAIGRHSHELLQTVHPLPRLEFEASLEREGEWKGELTHTARDGRKILVESRHVLIREADGRRLVLETNRDITERKRAEEALREARADLTHVNRVTTMGELTASLAHEVNQPIAAALTNANTCLLWLARDTPDIEEARAAARRIVQDGTRAADIISGSAGSSRRVSPQRDSVDVNEVIREMIILLSGEATRYAISVRTELAADLPQVMGDRVQLQQVMITSS